MSEHYSGHDPATGCGITLLVIILLNVFFWLVAIAAVLDLGVFA